MSIFNPLLLGIRNIIQAIGEMASEPGDSEAEQLRKLILANTALLFGIPALLLFAIIYSLFAEYAAAVLAFIGAVVMILSVSFIHGTRKNFSLFVFTNLSVSILSTFLPTLVLGGLVNGSFAMIWGLVAPLLAILYYSIRGAVYWLIAYLAAVFICVFAQPFLPSVNNIPFLVKNVSAAINMTGISLLVFSAFVYFVSQRDLAYGFLRKEREKSEKLLLNILPKETANTLKETEGVIADHYDGASILFADVVDFTPLSAGMTPEELVELLDEVFSYFDKLVEKYDLEKIKTIGDCYMVASGVPRPRTDHATIITKMAIEIRDYVDENTFCGRKLLFRIGVNSGPVVAGVIGRKKFIYDLWGDTVNTASRMESNGHGGDIQITKATYDLVKNHFHCRAQGTISVKGKGEMPVWYVVDEK